jgi:hypothetical protein
MQYQLYKSCIDACFSCAAECERCATECLKEDDIKILSRCISLNRECALICDTTARLMALNGDNASLLCQTCAEICEFCATECEQNIDLEHCKRCAIECHRCAEECRSMMALPA